MHVNSMAQVKYVFKNLVRDWSVEGAAERAQSYGRLLAELRTRLPPSPAAEASGAGDLQPQPLPPRVLVPGAGQGRLCLEAALQVWGQVPAMGLLLAEKTSLWCTAYISSGDVCSQTVCHRAVGPEAADCCARVSRRECVCAAESDA